MKKELEDMLYEDFPELFVRRLLPMSQTSMCFGLQHGDGWFNIINNMCIAIQAHIDHTNKQRVMAIVQSTAFYAKDLTKLPQYMHKAALDGDVTMLPTVGPEVIQVEFDVIKEKFGSLRIYANNCDEYCHGIIQMAECLSVDTCEITGRPGSLYIKDKRLVKTLCDDEAQASDGWVKDTTMTFTHRRRSQPAPSFIKQ